jgi:arsenate reductase (glutaredoxin)
MSDTVTFYHNPRCSKSRQALALLEAEGIIPTVVKYLEAPPTAAALSDLLDMLGLEPRGLMRKGEAEYTELNLANPDLTREQLIQAMVMHPRLIERPIMIKDGQAIIGRPPEKVLDLL